MIPIEECDKLTKPQLLIEIRNRSTLLKSMGGHARTEELREEVEKLWKMMKNS